MAPRSFTTTDLSQVPPIEFELAGETFRVPRKQRHDVMVMVANNLVTVANGEKQVKADACRQAILLFLADELYDPEALVFDETGLPVWDTTTPVEGDNPEAVQKRGAWVRVDDKDRFIRLTRGARVEIPDQTYGDILDYITTEVTGHPTGGRS